MAIIRELALDGPRMGCADIVPGEMHRLRRLSVVTPHLMPGDLHGMPNVVRMELTLGQSWPQPGSLEGPRGLRELGIRLTGPRRDWRVEPGTFRPMSMLRKLEINGRTNVRVHLTNRSLRGLKELRELQVDSLESAEPEALRMMPKLERLRLRAAFRLPAERDTAPELPPTVIRDAEKLESHELRNFREER